MTVNDALAHYDFVEIKKETNSRGEVFCGVELRKYEPPEWGRAVDEDWQLAFDRAVHNAQNWKTVQGNKRRIA